MGTEEKEKELVEIEEEVEGEQCECDVYYFDRIGKAIPIHQNDNHNDDSPPLFHPDFFSPSSPLAVSSLHGLIFLAHPAGFYVARIKDAMEAAEDIEANDKTRSSIHDFCIADVPIAKLRILSLSNDSSTLAVCVDQHVHFFLIDSLLNKELSPFFSCFLSEPSSSFVKDFKWRRSSENYYLLLSSHGGLYHSHLASSLQHIMDHVDAVEWSPEGSYMALVKGNILHILSSKNKEKLCISLPFSSWAADDCTVKVDSIRWVRSDSIVIGAFQQNADGKEENYLIQVLRSEAGKFTDMSPKPFVLSFYDLFCGLIDDILPYGNGPYLLLTYIEKCGLAVAANRKNTDNHILLLRWSVEDDITKTAAIHTYRDSWVPRIELQGNGDDNLIMGLGVDTVSLYKKFEAEVGAQQIELSPFCVLFCVTLEGKLVMFNVASAAGPAASPETHLALSEEEEFLPDLLVGSARSNLSNGTEKVDLGLQLNDMSKREPEIIEGCKVSVKVDTPSSNTKSSMSLQEVSHKDATTERQEVNSVLSLKPSVSDGKEKTSVTKIFQGMDSQQVLFVKQQSANFGQSSSNISPSQGPGYFAKPASQTENSKFGDFQSVPASLFEKSSANPKMPHGNDVQKSVNQPKDPQVSFGSTGSLGELSKPWSSEKVNLSGEFESRAAALTPPLIQEKKSENVSIVGDIPMGFAGKPFQLQDDIDQSTSTNISVRPARTVGHKASNKTGNIDSLPAIWSSQMPSLESLTPGRYTNYWPYSSTDARKASSQLNSEPYLLRQFGNLKEMTKELDSLLEHIEQPGGFRDACIGSQMDLVDTFEERMQTLSGKCRFLKSMMDEQLEEVQYLLDKTVQVLERKIYTDGIVKQASDSHYWELRNRQKLGSELELKRHHILKLNQVLTDQLIQLERHFNAIEIHKFDENDIVYRNQRVSQSRYGPPRKTQSLHSLHSTTNSQLAAAEQLSECLSKQMAVLSIESPVKRNNVKKELFENIGLPYDPTFSSPDSMKVGDSSSKKKLLLSGSASIKSQSRRRESSVIKSSDTETARRRRDSMDQIWASFEPSKTTVKRVILSETLKENVTKSPLMSSSPVSCTKDPTSFLSSRLGNKGSQYTFPKFEAKSTPSKSDNESLLQSQSTSQAAVSRSSIFESSDKGQPSVSPYQSLPMTQEVFSRETSSVATNKLNGMGLTRRRDSMFIHESKSIPQPETSLHNTSSVSRELPVRVPTSKNSNEMSNHSSTGAAFTNSRLETTKNGPTNEKAPFHESQGTSNGTAFSLRTAAVGVSSHSGKVPQFSVVASRSQPSGNESFSKASPMPLSFFSSPTIISSSNIASFGSIPSSSAPSLSPFNSKTKADANHMVSSTAVSSVSVPVFSSSFFSSQTPKSSVSLQTSSAVSEPLETEVQPACSELPLFNSKLTSVSESDKTGVQVHLGNAPLSVSTIPSPSTSFSSQSDHQSSTAKSSPLTDPSSPLTSEKEPSKGHLQPLEDKCDSVTDARTATIAPAEHGPAQGSKLQPSVSPVPTAGISTGLRSESQFDLNSMESPVSGMQSKQPSDAHAHFGPPLASDGASMGKSASLDVSITEQDEMEEEAPEASRSNELSLGSLGSFGLGSTPTSTAPRANPFGGSFGNAGTNQSSSPFTMTVPSGELFRPASFSFQSPQPSQSSSPTSMGAFSGGFGSKPATQVPAPSGFGQPAQIGAGQQALGSVLGSFGQSRQFGAGLTTGFSGGGFASANTMAGFASAATSGFAAATPNSGGFANLASGGGGFGGFASLASGSGGFGGLASGGGNNVSSPDNVGFAGAAGGGLSAAGGGFGSFNSLQGGGGFSAFSGNPVGNQAPSGFSAFSGNAGAGKSSEFFTQMRK